jgi:ribokinase
VVGSVNTDTVFDVEALPLPGETVLATSMTSTPGGKGGNQAVAAARAGARVQFVGAVGDDDAGARLGQHLNANNVGTDGLISLDGPSGNAAIIVESAGENSIVVAAGANGRLTLDSDEAHAVIAACDVLLLQLEIPVATAAAAAQAGRDAGATVMVNASPTGADPEQLAVLAAATDVLVVNETETEQWSWPVEHRVITLGSRGLTYLGADGRVDLPAVPVSAVDTSGAGDVFAGALAAGWATGREYALKRALAAGALATLTPGAGDCAPYSGAIDDALARD